MLLSAGVTATGVVLPVSAEVQSWLNYSRPAEYEAIVTEVRPVMRDGVTLECVLASPGRDGRPLPDKFPGIISNVQPYAIAKTIWVGIIKTWAEFGYQGLTCFVRGSGESEGEFSYYSDQEAPREWLDSYDLVEWLASQPGSNGRIGQEGASYGGFTTFQAAIAQPPHLVAIAPQVAPGSMYLDNVYPGGIKTRRYVVDAWPVAAWMTNTGDFSPYRLWDQWLAHSTLDGYWEGFSITPRLAKVNVPVLIINGWYDNLFRRGSLRNYMALQDLRLNDKVWMLMGPWEHELIGMPRGVLLAWFDHWLKENQDAPLPPARVISYEGPEETYGWRTFERWPPRDAEEVTLALRQDGALGDAPGEKGSLAFEQHRASGLLLEEDNVVFTSAPLTTDWVLAGGIEVHLTARFSQPDAHLQAALYELRNGEERLIERGWLKLSHRNSHVTPEPVVPGEAVSLTLEIWDVHQRIPAGSQLVLKISGGDVWHRLAAPSAVRTDVATGADGSALMLTVLYDKR